MEALKRVIEELGGCPLLRGEAWDGARWTLEKTITSMRKTLGFRTDKLFDIASFIINLENANNVSPLGLSRLFSRRLHSTTTMAITN